MRRLVISVLASVTLFAAATAMQQSPSTGPADGTPAMPPLQELYTTAGANDLPIEDFEDMSLAYSTGTRH
jgi:hypothetical protein